MSAGRSFTPRPGIRAVLAGLVFAALIPSVGQSQPFAGPVWSKLNKKCVAVQNGATADGTRIIMSDCTGGNIQMMNYLETGEVRVLNKCLTTNGTQGNFIELWACTGYAGQKWTYSVDQGTYKGMNGLCMVIAGANAASGANLVAYGCNPGAQDNQTWSLPGGRFSQYNAFMTDDGRCIWATLIEAGVGPCTMGYAVWTAFYDSENFFMLRSVDGSSFTCLTTGAKGVKAKLSACDRTKASQRLLFNTSGQMQVSGTNLCLDVSGGTRNVSNSIVSWDCDLNTSLASRAWNQKFALALFVPTWQLQAVGTAYPLVLGGVESLIGRSLTGSGRTISTIIAAGGGNIVAGGGGNVVAGGAGNIVAGGGGNVSPRNPVAGGGASIVAAGGGNIYAAAGGSIIAATGIGKAP